MNQEVEEIKGWIGLDADKANIENPDIGKIYIAVDTNKTYIWYGSSWVELGGGVTDHGALTGLSDDDHPLYVTKTTQELSIYVDASTGDDTTGDGTSGNPYKTIMKAVNSVPDSWLHYIYINVNKGTYNEQLTFARHIMSGYSMVVRCYDLNNNPLYDNGLATGGGNNYLDDTNKSWVDDQFNGGYIWIYNGTGMGQIRTISDTTETRITVSSNWDTNPDNTSRYVIGGLVTVDGGSSACVTSLTDRIRFYGFRFVSSATNYMFNATKVRNIVIYNCMFENSVGYGIVSHAANLSTYWCYFNIKKYGHVLRSVSGGYVGRGCFYTAPDKVASRGISIVQNSHIEFVTSSSVYKSLFKDLQTGIACSSGSMVENGSKQNFIGCTKKWTHSGTDDVAGSDFAIVT